MTSYAALRVPVRGGELAGGVWTPDGVAPGPTVLAIHGITASHLSWPLVADRLAVPLVAMDLRGRGRSNALPAPFDLRSHAADMVAVMDHLALERVVVVGHSMGAFVAVCLAEVVPERIASLVLVDGGLPIPPPHGVAPKDVAALVLGPALKRLSMTFASREAYAQFWRAHPALGPYWNDAIASYVDYDLEGTEPTLSASSNPDAVAENSVQLDGHNGYTETLQKVEIPIDFLRAPRGLADQVPPLYPDVEIARLSQELTAIRFHENDDVNHYTIVLTPQGADQVAEIITSQATPTVANEVTE